jgi:hypothetical protein
MEIVQLLLLIATIVFIATLGSLGIYSGHLAFKKKNPETIDLEFFKKYNTKEEREVDEEDRGKVWRYASTGWIQTGLSMNSKLTAKLTERGRRLLMH